MQLLEYYPRITHWTEEALNCYRRNCVCKGCILKEAYFQNKECLMKLAVLESVRKLGRPIGIDRQSIIED